MPLKISKAKRRILLCSPGVSHAAAEEEVVMRIKVSRITALLPVSLH